ncbi:MAG: hypothetical protein ACP5VF_03020, partial [Acidobacteriota bacterium]
ALAPILASLARGTPGRFLIHGVTASGKTEVYLRAIEETVEKATAAKMIPVEARAYALGLLATANAVGDLSSSVLTGWLLDHAGRVWAYGVAAAFTGAGFLALLAFTLTHGRRLDHGGEHGSP